MTIRPALETAWTGVGETLTAPWLLGAASPSPLVPAWVAVPLGALTLIMLAAHMRALAVADMPESRRRIRTANGWVMLLATPVTAYAFGVATPADPRLFLLSWLAVAGLLAIVLLLAAIDIMNTGRLSLDARQELRRDLHDLGRDLGRDRAAPEPPRDGRA